MPVENVTTLSQTLVFLHSLRAFLLSLWWLWAFPILFLLARSLWLAYIREYYKRAIKWAMWELRLPREVLRSPRAMEQVFMSFHALRNAPGNIKEMWWDGEVAMWFSCELTSFGGELHFYLRAPERHRAIVEAALYAQYPDVELIEVNPEDDYIYRLPPTWAETRAQGYNLFGSELILAERDVYPIRTYVDFEENEEERQLDPIATILETLSKVKPREHVWIQILITPRDNSWKKEGEEEIELLKEKTGKRQMFSPQFGEFIMIDRAPGEVERMKALDRSISKPGFDTLIRYLYIAPRDTYSANFGQRGILSAFNQYASESFNKFRHNVFVWTRGNMWRWPHVFPERRVESRRQRLYKNYRARATYDETFGETILQAKGFHLGLAAWRAAKSTLNAEELATIFHLPMNMVLTAPLIRRAEARKIGPPAGLPIYGEEGEKLPGAK